MEIFEYDPQERGRFGDSVVAKVRLACQNCPDSIEPGEHMVPDYSFGTGSGNRRGWVHDECAY